MCKVGGQEWMRCVLLSFLPCYLRRPSRKCGKLCVESDTLTTSYARLKIQETYSTFWNHKILREECVNVLYLYSACMYCYCVYIYIFGKKLCKFFYSGNPFTICEDIYTQPFHSSHMSASAPLSSRGAHQREEVTPKRSKSTHKNTFYHKKSTHKICVTTKINSPTRM